MRYRVSSQTIDITASTTLNPDQRYGAWMAVNQGSSPATVMGYELLPGEGLDMLNAVPAGSTWDTPIQIRVQGGGLVRITRLQYTEEG